MARDKRSEYEGGGVLPNTIFPKGPDALTSHDKLRLQSLTGQETVANAPVDPYHWQGKVEPEPLEEFDEEAALRDEGRYE